MESHREIAERWYDQIAIKQHEHYLAALHFSRLHYWIGIPLILLTAILGKSVFARTQHKRSVSSRVALGTLSVSATILAALQTLLSYNERVVKHQIAGTRYANLNWQLALMLAQDPGCTGLDDIGKQLDALAQESPNIPGSVDKAMAGYRPRWQRVSN